MCASGPIKCHQRLFYLPPKRLHELCGSLTFPSTANFLLHGKLSCAYKVPFEAGQNGLSRKAGFLSGTMQRSSTPCLCLQQIHEPIQKTGSTSFCAPRRTLLLSSHPPSQAWGHTVLPPSLFPSVCLPWEHLSPPCLQPRHLGPPAGNPHRQLVLLLGCSHFPRQDVSSNMHVPFLGMFVSMPTSLTIRSVPQSRDLIGFVSPGTSILLNIQRNPPSRDNTNCPCAILATGCRIWHPITGSLGNFKASL